MTEKMVTMINWMGDDLSVVNSARVSMHKFNETFDDVTDARLIRYLAKHEHWTPFSQVIFQFRIKMPIFVARQWFRHNIGITRNEVSRRYVSDEPEFWAPGNWRTRPENVKQGSGEDLPNEVQESMNAVYEGVITKAKAAYEFMLHQGVCPEQARTVLPLSLMTEFIETASLAAYARIFKLRTDEHAQREIRDYALLIGDEIKKTTPVSWDALTGVA